VAGGYDAIVVGLGAMGSAAAAHLAQRGQRVLGLEQYLPVHARGSTHGKGRIIREAYFEDPAYVPLVQRAYELWRDLEQESGRQLLRITGGLNIGLPNSDFVAGSKLSGDLHGLPYDYLSASEVFARFPGIALPEEMDAVYEPNAGILLPEACVDAYQALARRHGADLRFETCVDAWETDANGVNVRTSQGSFSADRLVVTTGPWTAAFLESARLPLTVWRIVNVHFESRRPELFDAERFPVFLMQVPEGDYYGFPYVTGEGVKIGRHDIGEVCTPETIRRDVDRDEVDMLRAVLDRYMPGASGEVKWTLTCMYTNTPDRHFIIERDPERPNVVYGCGFSGHGFKFASAIGEVLADLALDGSSRHEIGFLSSARFALT
jgi:sarcosine oxidase